MRPQRSVARELKLEGVGLHRGENVCLIITPAEAGRGLVFVRDDLGGKEIPALQQFRAPMINASRLQCGEASVDTPEHLLAALFALGIDNATLHLSGSEVPILDGSALPFAYALLEVGTTEQTLERPRIVMARELVIEEDGCRLEIQPGKGLRITAGIDFEHQHLGYQDLTVRLDEIEDFLLKLAPARTFALRRDIVQLQNAGLIKGGSLDNAILIEEDGVAGSELRFADEFVRHKLLDLVGDLALLGCSLEGRIVAWRAGHALHGRLVDAILSDRSAWSFEGTSTALSGPPGAPSHVGRGSGG